MHTTHSFFILAGVLLVGCGSNTSLFNGTGGAGGKTTTGTGAGTASGTGTGTGGTQSASSGGGASSSSGSMTTSSGSMSTSSGSTTTSSSTSSSGGACGTCPGNEVCCASANPPHCYNPSCLACCMSSGTSSSSSAASSASSTGGLPCPQPCGQNHTCCNGVCVDELVDINNCGACGHHCGNAVTSHPYCNNGTCMDPPCQGIACTPAQTCCGTSCCNLGELCCNGPGGQTPPTCKAAVNGTCPAG